MAYQKQTWREYDDTKTELQNALNGALATPERLNHIENGIANSADKAEVTAQLQQTEQELNAQLADINAMQTGLLNFKGSDTTANINAKTGMVTGDYWWSTDGLTYYAYTGTDWSNVGSSLTELSNVRVGADGTTFPTAGDSVRQQVGELQNVPYAPLKKNYFYANYDTIKEQELSYVMNSYGNQVCRIITDPYYNGVELDASTYAAFIDVDIVSSSLSGSVEPRFSLAIMDGWSARYNSSIVAWDGLSNFKLFTTIDYADTNNLKCTLALIAEQGFTPSSGFSFKVNKMGLFKSTDNIIESVVTQYPMSKKYPSLNFPEGYIEDLIGKQSLLDRLDDLELAQNNDFSVFDQAYILNNKLIGNELTPTSNNIAQYTVSKMSADVKTIKCKVIFKGGAKAALISEPNGMYSVLDVTKKSIHIVFGKTSVSIGYFVNGVLTNIEVKNYSASLNETQEYTIGYTVVTASNTITVHLPDGTDYSIMSAELVACNGVFAIWEHYINVSAQSFARVEFTKFWVKDVNDNVLCDDFKRLNGAIGVAPTGHVYGQFTNYNQTGWVI